MSSAILSTIAVQAESSFAGNGTGSIYRLCGLLSFEDDYEPVSRTTRISVWREEESQGQRGAFYRGRIEIELRASIALNLLVRTLLAEKSSGAVTGGTEYVYHARRSSSEAIQSVKIRGAFEAGPWFTLNGVVLVSLRVSVRTLAVATASIEWIAASKESVDINPAWTVVDESLAVMKASSAAIELDAQEDEALTEFAVEFRQGREPRNINSSGQPTRLGTNGPIGISGTLSQYLEAENDVLAPLVRSQNDFSVLGVLSDGSFDRVELSLPRAVAQSGQPAINGDSDVATTVPIKALSGYDGNDVPTLKLLLP